MEDSLSLSLSLSLSHTHTHTHSGGHDMEDLYKAFSQGDITNIRAAMHKLMQACKM